MNRPTSVSFFSEGERVVGDLRLPLPMTMPVTAQPPPLVIFCAGMTLTKEVWLPPWAEAMNARGWATLNFDHRGFGGSGGARLRLVPQQQVDDIRNAITWAESREDVDASRIALVGVSLGAATALGAAGVEGLCGDRVKAAACVAGPSDLWRVWSALPNFPSFFAKVKAARRQYVATGEAKTMKLSKLLSSDPGTCALIEHDAPLHASWLPELTFESLASLFEFRPEKVAAFSKATLFVTCGNDSLIGRTEAVSAWASCREPRRLTEIPDIVHHEIYGDGKGFAPAIAAVDGFFRDVGV